VKLFISKGRRPMPKGGKRRGLGAKRAPPTSESALSPARKRKWAALTKRPSKSCRHRTTRLGAAQAAVTTAAIGEGKNEGVAAGAADSRRGGGGAALALMQSSRASRLVRPNPRSHILRRVWQEYRSAFCPSGNTHAIRFAISARACVRRRELV
jgi:hypothetical protein